MGIKAHRIGTGPNALRALIITYQHLFGTVLSAFRVMMVIRTGRYGIEVVAIRANIIGQVHQNGMALSVSHVTTTIQALLTGINSSA